MMKHFLVLIFIFSIFSSLAQKPNIVYILADDLGYGDLSCYGQEKITTPVIDQLSKDGMRFTRHYSGSTVCAPTRSALMTGLHTGHTLTRGNGNTTFEQNMNTVPVMFKSAGYVTGMFGKWGLGNYPSSGDPGKQSWDDFVGYTHQGLAHRYYPPTIINNGEKLVLEGNDWSSLITYAPDVIQKEALEFIDENHEKPFFFYYPTIIPHAEMIAPEDSIFAMYDGVFPEKNYNGKDYIGSNTKETGYCSQNKPRAMFAAMIKRLDIYIGQILDKLDEYGLTENTVIIFSSDNGPHKEGGHDPNFWNSSGGLRGIKRDLYEGGIRVPFIVKWPGTVQAGTESKHISAHWDMFPTFIDIIDAEYEYEGDGISLVDELRGNSEQEKHEALYWEFYEKNGRRAVLKDNWKLVQYDMSSNPNRAVQLFNLDSDPGEKNNIASNHQEILAKMKNLLELGHEPSSRYRFSFETKPVYPVEITVLDNEGNPVENALFSLDGYGDRMSVKKGVVKYNGVANGKYNCSIKIDEKIVWQGEINVNDHMLKKTVTLVVGAKYFAEANKIFVHYSPELKKIYVKARELKFSKVCVYNMHGQMLFDHEISGKYHSINIQDVNEPMVFVAVYNGNRRMKNAKIRLLPNRN